MYQLKSMKCYDYFENGCPPENVSNVRAGNNLEGSPTHPGFEAQFKVLSAPDVKPSE